jgi:GNAT superfamily N-acetyltransferase
MTSQLVSLMAEFYAEGGCELHRERAASVFAAMLDDERLGYVWIVQAEHHDVGRAVLTLEICDGIRWSGRRLDDLYVKSDWRKKGLSTAALTQVSPCLRRSWHQSCNG